MPTEETVPFHQKQIDVKLSKAQWHKVLFVTICSYLGMIINGRKRHVIHMHTWTLDMYIVQCLLVHTCILMCIQIF